MCEKFLKKTSFKTMKVPIDAPPNSLKDSNVSLMVKTMKEGVRVHFLTHDTSRVRRACWSSKMGIKMNDK
jgi:hypothetical protein